MWLAASSFDVPDGVLATLANPQLNPKPHQGLSSKNPASHPALDERNSTAALGLRAGLLLNGLRQSERARYYGSALGRFTTPDEFKGGFDNLDGKPAFSPGPIGYADLSDPQTLNMYVYTRNNPLRFIDPDGHDFLDYLSGVGNAFISDNAFGAGRSGGGNDDFRAGQVVGDAVATITGSLEALGGGGEAVVTSPAALTGVGALVPAAGAAVAAHGATTAAIAGGHLVAAAASKVDDIAGQIEQGGYQVTQNPKTPNQEGNVTISHPDQPGTRVNVRVETHPIAGSGGKPVRHANVEVVKPGPKNRPRVESNEHIDQ